MANELQNKLDAILENKNTNLKPEYLKAGTTCLGVTGTFDVPIKLLASVDEMNNIESPKEGERVMVYADDTLSGLYEYKTHQDLDTVSFPFFSDAVYDSSVPSVTINNNTNPRKYNRAKLMSLLKLIKTTEAANVGAMQVFEINSELYAAYMTRIYNSKTLYEDDPRLVIESGRFVNKLTSSISYSSLHTHTLFLYKLDVENQTYTKTTKSPTGSHKTGYYFTITGLNTIPMYIKFDYGELTFYHIISYDTDVYTPVVLPTDTSLIYSPYILGWTYLSTQLTLNNPTQLLEGKIAYGETGLINGTMKNNGELVYNADEIDQIIPMGYTDGGKINASVIGAKLFGNLDELQANDTSTYQGNRFGMVYGKKYRSYLPGSTVTKMDYAEKVVLPEPVTTDHTGMVTYGDVSMSGMADFHIELTPHSCRMYRDAMSYYTNTLFEYTSEDGVTYIRTTTSDTFTLGIGDDYPWTAEYDTVISNFVTIGDPYFEGVYSWENDTTKIPLYAVPELNEDATFSVKLAINENVLDAAVNILYTKAMPNMNIRTSMTYVPFVVIRKSDTVYQFHYYSSYALSTTNRYIYDTKMLYDVNGYHIGGNNSSYFDSGWYYVEVNTSAGTYTHNELPHTEGYNTNYHFGYTFSDTDIWASIRVKQSDGTFTKTGMTIYNLTVSSTLSLPSGKHWVPVENQFTVTTNDMVEGKTAYTNGEVIEGSLIEFTPDTADVSTEYVTSSIANSDDDTQIVGIKSDVLKDFAVREGSFIRTQISYSDMATWFGITADIIKSGETILGITGTYTGATDDIPVDGDIVE